MILSEICMLNMNPLTIFSHFHIFIYILNNESRNGRLGQSRHRDDEVSAVRYITLLNHNSLSIVSICLNDFLHCKCIIFFIVAAK